tara:strand:- start:1195 stop:1452 length:258 start_codon:yes stop_codon:yes gene_type:complete
LLWRSLCRLSTAKSKELIEIGIFVSTTVLIWSGSRLLLGLHERRDLLSLLELFHLPLYGRHLPAQRIALGNDFLKAVEWDRPSGW